MRARNVYQYAWYWALTLFCAVPDTIADMSCDLQPDTRRCQAYFERSITDRVRSVSECKKYPYELGCADVLTRIEEQNAKSDKRKEKNELAAFCRANPSAYRCLQPEKHR